MKQKYLIIPSVPTPNGHLHLGHIGGPFLTADIITRVLQRQGHEAKMICGTDTYESFVVHKAVNENKSSEEICHDYHKKIAADLQAMDINIDTFINPLADEWRNQYGEWQHFIFKKLENMGAITAIDEQVLWDEKAKRYRVGCWLQGKCPVCKMYAESYFCENCGAYFRPEELILNKNTFFSEKTTNLFMKVPTDLVHSSLKKLYQDTMTQQKGLMRLTANSDWGLAVPSNASLPSSTLFSYGLIFAYFLMMGKIAGKEVNAFSINSSVKTISCFGIDNAVAFLASALGVTHHCKEYKPFDYLIPNYFYLLNNKKFSKSKGHAIFVNDLIIKSSVSSDIVRFFLATINVRDQVGYFSADEFVVFYNKTILWINAAIINQFKANQDDEMPILCDGILKSLLKNQNDLLHPSQFLPHLAVKTIYSWLTYTCSSHQWLKGMSLLMYPFMPKLAQCIWHNLGYLGCPAEMQHETTIPIPLTFPHYKQLSRDDLHAVAL
ncbi:MAG: class I tRNA ligase family protein [Gammaproteobacteria bacterium]|nr:class I tRNA ligase family protein [Gammaproteobacteria bacterium]